MSNITLGNLGTMFMPRNSLQNSTGNTLVLPAKSELQTSQPFPSVPFHLRSCRDVTPLKGGWMSGDTRLLEPPDPLYTLGHPANPYPLPSFISPLIIAKHIWTHVAY